MSIKNKHTDVDKESLRLDYVFEKGINFKDRIIQITGAIEENTSFDWLDAALTEMERGSKKAITLKINSPGGSVYEALAMVDRIRESKCQIITKCYGHAMSAAGLILAAGNKRYIGKNSWFMHHEISAGIMGSLSEMQQQLQQIDKEFYEWARALSEFTNTDKQFWIEEASKKDFYLSSSECILYGIVDDVF